MANQVKPILSEMSPSERLRADPVDFSLVLGGPLYQLYRRAHLSGDALELLRRRITVAILVTWLPLLVLSTLQAQLLGGSSSVPFLFDMEVHARFLVAMPLLIVAELVIHKRTRFILRQFLDRNLIPEDAKNEFDAALASALRLRNSISAEVLLIAFVYTVGVLIIWRHYTVLQAATWYTEATAAGLSLTPAGIWYGYVSMPIFQFLLLRWYFRLFIWARLFWRVSRIPLCLVATHPDRVGGLGFLSLTADAFIPFALAHGAVLSGIIGERIFHLGATLPDFAIEIGVIVFFIQCIVFCPLCIFSSQLGRIKRTALLEYGTLAERYVREFDTKWLRGGAPEEEPFVGSSDIQSLADLGNSFEVVKTMKMAPVTRNAVLTLAVATLLPIAPLALTMMPLHELLKKLLGILV